MHSIVIRPEAELDIDHAKDWYDDCATGLRLDFLKEIDRVLLLLSHTPKMHQLCYRDMRRARLRRFPYSLIYKVKRNAVFVMACIHDRQDSSTWKSRR